MKREEKAIEGETEEKRSDRLDSGLRRSVGISKSHSTSEWEARSVLSDFFRRLRPFPRHNDTEWKLRLSIAND
jgi:hypothetical protein